MSIFGIFYSYLCVDHNLIERLVKSNGTNNHSYAIDIYRMSVVGNNRVGIPIVALHDAEGAVIEVETKNGELIRGLLFEAEDMMNLYIKNAVIVDNVTGVKRKSNQVYLQGSNIVMIVLPDMLKYAPMFNR
jgi:small nuclear ribonucleoprotein D3